MIGKLFSRLKAANWSMDKALGYDISTSDARRRARWHLQYIDHGFLRGRWTNLFEVAPGVWRSNQPDPARIKRYADMGIRSVLNLRGTAPRSPFIFEQEACIEHGIELVSIGLAARNLVPRDVFLTLLDTFETIEGPFVMHCKSGADRAGLASAMYLLHMKGASIADARKQLSFKYLHVKFWRTGILDHLMDKYEADCADGMIPIREWLETRYDQQGTIASFKASTIWGKIDGQG